MKAISLDTTSINQSATWIMHVLLSQLKLLVFSHPLYARKEEMNLKNVQVTYTGGIDGERGWKGDVKNMLPDINKLKSHGWKPKHNNAEALRKTVKHLVA